MTDAITEIKETYSYEDAKEIVNHGCESGVCFKHIYNADTVEFFNKYPDEITRYVIESFGIECITESFTRHNGNWDYHFNDLVWMFIELVCDEIVNEVEYESTTCEELSDSDLLQYTMFGINPERSMTDSRYAQV